MNKTTHVHNTYIPLTTFLREKFAEHFNREMKG